MKTDRSATATAGSYWALFVLFLANIFNVGDRIIFGVVVQPIKLELGLSDTQMSLASGLFYVLFNLGGGLFIARFVDRGNRIRILAIGVTCWSLATAATGFTHDFATLSLARIAVGIGEATAFPAAMSLIPDLFRLEVRGKAVGAFQTSNFIGIVGGTIIAGMLGAIIGWRSMFIACGIAGLVVPLLLLVSVREPVREVAISSLPAQSYWEGLVKGCRRIIGLPGFPSLLVGYGLSGMMLFVLGAWGPAFLLRSHGVPLAQVGLIIGPAVGIGGIAGTLTAGYLSDRLLKQRGHGADMLKIPLVAIPLSMPFMAAFAFAENLAVAMGAAAVMNFLLSGVVPATMNFAINRTEAGDRGLTSMVLLAANSLIGGALGPLIVGATSDWLTPAYGNEALRYGITTMLLAPPLALIFYIGAYRRATSDAG